ncbi:AraC family transcriptional regulator [Actinoplanes couchii]|uniref:AraC family transcriptional regulator n=1 Tax=Actinoplanes couchii TaxID=403638 RepID=A0ABQ3XEL2_9ACTN|nr:AraC family transcriptional regulator [Actinoplanes couchii]MDR6319809.1 AraC-like DNA-binding protein [Actinoplanes couchii]GID56944.1 AraC family transcriptional regulator [Actinoplanes couchii]
MDVISEAVEGLRIGRAYGRRIEAPGGRVGRSTGFVGVGFHVVLGGQGWLISEDQPPVRVGKGDVVLAPHGAPHGFWPSPDALHTLPIMAMGPVPPPDGPDGLDFICGAYRLDTGGTLHPYLRSLPPVLTVTPDPVLSALVQVLAADMTQHRPGAEVTRPALVDLTLIHVLRIWHDTTGGKPWQALGDPVIAAALHLIHERPQDPWTVERLSRTAGLSRTAFTRRFTARVGTPPMAYVISSRLTRGARMLRETDAPLATIASRVGYATEFAFSGAFRREFGMAPGRFRQSRG